MKLKELMEEESEFLTDPDEIFEWVQTHSRLLTMLHRTDMAIGDNGLVSFNADINIAGYNLSNIPVRFHKTNDFICSNNNLSTLQGCPREVHGTFYCDRNKLTSFEGAPSYIGASAMFDENDIKTLEGIHEIIEHVNNHIYLPSSIIRGGIGLILIKNLVSVNAPAGASPEFRAALRIIRKYLRRPNDIFECQAELINANLEEFAQL